MKCVGKFNSKGNFNPLQIVTNGRWRFIFSTSSTSLPSAGKFNPFNFPVGGKAE
jgi:hypothetical protein